MSQHWSFCGKSLRRSLRRQPPVCAGCGPFQASQHVRVAWPAQEWNSGNGEGTPSLKMTEPVRRSLVSPGTQRRTSFTLHAARSTRMGHSHGQDGFSLCAVASLFDPLGLVSATHFTGRILLQRAWQKTSSWDQPLGPQLAVCVEIWWGEQQHARTCRFQGG